MDIIWRTSKSFDETSGDFLGDIHVNFCESAGLMGNLLDILEGIVRELRGNL